MHDSDSAIEYPSMYGSLSEDLEKEAATLCKGKTIEQLRQIGEYFQNKASSMTREVEKNVKMEDFDKVMKRNPSDNKDEY